MGDGAGFFLTGDLSTQRVVTVFALTAIRQALFEQLAKAVPAQRVATAVGVTDFQQATVQVVAVMGFVAVRIDLDGDVALTISIVFPSCFATFDAYQLAVEIAVIGWKSFRGNEGDQASGIVVAVFSDCVECIFFCNQTTLFVVDFL